MAHLPRGLSPRSLLRGRREASASEATPRRDPAAGDEPEVASRAAFEAYLSLTVEDVPIVLDDRERIVRAGAGAARLAQRTTAELTGMTLIAAFGSVALDALGREAREHGEPVSGEIQLGRLGSRTFRVELLPTHVGGLLILLHDVTAMRRMERIRRDFVANISHELRTPLSSIKLIAETLASGAVEDEVTARDFAEQIQREVDHLAQLVDELLELSMIESGELKLAVEPVDPQRALEAVRDRMRAVAERRRISLRILPAPALEVEQYAAADPSRLSQALVNLVHNAIKFSRPGGEVRLEWQPRPGAVRFVVADDGVGIPASHLPRIFERFYKVDRSRIREEEAESEPQPGGVRTGSAGLGLAIVRHLAEAHGGAAGAESEEGIGSRFWLELPASS
ncbi:MAG: sensor histidine kinase [Candidatus Limnocylindria bacterium]